MQRTDQRERFGALRALLQRAPSEQTWQELCQLYQGTLLDEIGEQEQHYVHQHLARWPDHVAREADPTWIVLAIERQRKHPLLRWSNTLHLNRDRMPGGMQAPGLFAHDANLFDELHTLTLTGERQSLDELSTLLMQPYARTLRLLGVQGRMLATDQAMNAFTSTLNANLPQLDHLILTDTGIRPTMSARRFLRSPSARALESLDLSANHLGAGGGELLQQGLSSQHELVNLTLAECDLTHHAMPGLAMALRQTPRVSKLDLHANALSDEALCELFELTASGPIAQLNLSGNVTGVQALNALARSQRMLRELSLDLPARQHHIAAELEEDALEHGFDALEHLILGDQALELWSFLFDDPDAFPALTKLTIQTLPGHQDLLDRWVEDILDLGLDTIEILDLKISAAHLEALEALHDAHDHMFVRIVESEKRAKLIDELRSHAWSSTIVHYVSPLASIQVKSPWMATRL